MRTAQLAMLALVLWGGRVARAGAALFLEEPFGLFGHMNPTGHAAVYLSRVCADSPVRLLRCEPDETGAVISRYHRIDGYDWIAIPVIPYLYAVENLGDVPRWADAAMVAALRDRYRRRHLLEIAPDVPGTATPPGEWIQLVGAAFDRKIYSIEFETTPEQDDRLIQILNSKPNNSRFNLLLHNCADFSKSIVNFYYPHAAHRSLFSDAAIHTPEQVGRSLISYSRHNSELHLSVFAISQVPGTLARSGPLRGVTRIVPEIQEICARGGRAAPADHKRYSRGLSNGGTPRPLPQLQPQSGL